MSSFSNQPFDPANKVIVVTGGGGIGAALCRAFAVRHASAIICADIDESKAQETCRDIATNTSNGTIDRLSAACRTFPKKVDVTKDDEIRTLIEWVEANVGPIDLFFGNAGIMPPPDSPELNGATARKGIFATDSDIQRVMDVNFMHLVSAARHLVPRYLKRGGGFFWYHS